MTQPGTPTQSTAIADMLVSPNPALQQAVQQVGAIDPDFLKIEPEVGALQVRCWTPGFASLVRVIVGQQLSSRAAQAIFRRLHQHVEMTPANLVNCSEADLRQVGLSRAKVTTCYALANAILQDQLPLETLASLSDSAIVEYLTQIKGIGIWTAEVYMLFCLNRLDIFPAADLAIQVGYQRLKQLEHRPSRTELIRLCQPLSPYRGAAAHLLWHYYRQFSQKSR